MKAVKTIKAVAVKVAGKPVSKRIPVSDTNVRKAAIRLVPNGLVSTEIQYVQHVLGNSATQEQIDEKVIAVRKMSWSSIVLPE
jgi:DNA-binding GntR family transcriptional regulator